MPMTVPPPWVQELQAAAAPPFCVRWGLGWVLFREALPSCTSLFENTCVRGLIYTGLYCKYMSSAVLTWTVTQVQALLQLFMLNSCTGESGLFPALSRNYATRAHVWHPLAVRDCSVLPVLVLKSRLKEAALSIPGLKRSLCPSLSLWCT